MSDFFPMLMLMLCRPWESLRFSFLGGLILTAAKTSVAAIWRAPESIEGSARTPWSIEQIECKFLPVFQFPPRCGCNAP